MKHIFCNWKMYLDYAESVALAKKVAGLKFDKAKTDMAIFPSYLAIKDVKDAVRKKGVAIGGQNCAWTPKGAYTGAVSALLLKEIGCEYALVGHSERRHIFGEKEGDVRKKIEACLDVGITPVVCVGETKEEKNAGRRDYRLKKQIASAFENLKLNSGRVIVAYEPVWAIGTGDACLPADVDDVHGWLKLELKKYFDKSVPILYGGSVTSENVVSYLALETVDGALIGGISTKFEDLKELIEAVQGK